MRYTESGALVSECNEFRYRLWRRWGDRGTALVFIMLNPSTADGSQDDPTIRKCVGFADRLGYGGIEVVNLFAYRATNPADLKRAGFPVGPQNDVHIAAVLSVYPAVMCAWGANAACAAGWARVKQIASMLELIDEAPLALRLTTNGVPYHPLMLPYSCEPVPYKLEGVV